MSPQYGEARDQLHVFNRSYWLRQLMISSFSSLVCHPRLEVRELAAYEVVLHRKRKFYAETIHYTTR